MQRLQRQLVQQGPHPTRWRRLQARQLGMLCCLRVGVWTRQCAKQVRWHLLRVDRQCLRARLWVLWWSEVVDRQSRWERQLRRQC